MMKSFIIALTFLLALPMIHAQHGFPPQARRHHARHQGLAIRAEGNVQLHKRVSNSKWSFYDTEESGNPGACGRHIRNSEFVVAMNMPQYTLGDCFKTITLSWGGKTVQATIGDACPSCPWGGLDLSMSLFSFFAHHDKGIIWDGEWWFGGEPPAPTTTWAPPPPTTTWTPPPTATWTPPTTTSAPPPTTEDPPPTTTSTPPPETTTSTDANTSVLSSSAAAVGGSSAVPASAAARVSSSVNSFDRPTGSTTVPGGNLEALSQVMLAVGNIAITGAALPRTA